MYISCIYHVYIIYISCIYHVYIMYISCIYQIYIYIYIYIMYISCISHLHRYIYIYIYIHTPHFFPEIPKPVAPRSLKPHGLPGVFGVRKPWRAHRHLTWLKSRKSCWKKKNLYSDFNEIWVSFEFNQCYHPRIFLLYHGTVRILSHTPGWSWVAT